MKFLKYFFYALLPIMLLMMFFSYNNFSFLSAKAGASSTTNTINFYGKDNYLIGSYEVPNGQTINNTEVLTGYRDITVNCLPDTQDATNGISGTPVVFDNLFAFSDDKSIFSYNGNAKRFYSSKKDYISLYYDFGLPDFHDAGVYDFKFGYLMPNFIYPSIISYSAGEVDLYSSYRPTNTFELYYTIFAFDNNYNFITSYIVSDDVSSIRDYEPYSLIINNIPNFNYNSSYYYYFGITGSINTSAPTATYPGVSFYYDTYYNELTYTSQLPILSPLSVLVNEDISNAVSNGYLDLQDNYSWSTQSNFNNNFTYDTPIYYDLDLYYVQDNKVFNFANGWQSTLGDLSNLSFFTNTALVDLIADFNTFSTLNFNGDFLHVLKTIGLAIANIFNVIISLAQLVVAPLIDMVSIIVLLITKSSFFWTFT